MFEFSVKFGNKAKQADTSASNNMFGSFGSNALADTNMDFIPVDMEGGTISLNKEAELLGLDLKPRQYYAYKYCSPLAGIIDRIAEADANGILSVQDEDGITLKKESISKEVSSVIKLFKKPNPLQTWYEFDTEQVVYCKIHGWCLVFFIRPAGFKKYETKSMWNINPQLAEPVANPAFDPFNKNSNPILYWEIQISEDGEKFKAYPEDVLLIKDGFISEDGLVPLSKLVGLDFYVSNIIASMEADNVIIKKKGPLGIFSYDQKPDMAGVIPMGAKEKNELQQDLRQYGLTLSQFQYIISRVPIKWIPTSFNVKDLMTKETARQSIDAMCDRMSYPAELMSGKNATYENRSSAERYLYQSNIIPFSLRRMLSFNNHFEFEEQKIFLDYSHLAVLQDDIVKRSQADKFKSESLQIDWESGIITLNEYRKAKNMEPIPDGDIYFIEYQSKQVANETSSKDTGTKK